MKQNLFIWLVVACLSVQGLFAQGKFAGSYRSLIGKTYQNKDQLPLYGMSQQGGTMMGNIYAAWFRKGNLALVLFEEPSKEGIRIRDVLEISTYSDALSLQFGNCFQGKLMEDNAVAMVRIDKGDLLSATSAWRWNDQTKSLDGVDKNEASRISCPLQPFNQMAGPSWKPYVNKVYKDSKDIPALKDYTLREGSLLASKVGVSLFIKASVAVLVFEFTLEDNSRFVFDILETRLTEAQDIRIGLCRNGQTDSPGIVAIVEKSTKERWQAVKAWQCDTFQLVETEINAKEVTCLGKYGEN